ncbi:solute carrier family 23 protein, partial [Morganella morganii]
SDWLLVRIGANPGESTLDRMIALVEGAKRQKTPNEVALDILLIGLTLIKVGLISMGGGFSAMSNGTFANGENLLLSGVVLGIIVVL